jgi:hypothetical protein
MIVTLFPFYETGTLYSREKASEGCRKYFMNI